MRRIIIIKWDDMKLCNILFHFFKIQNIKLSRQLCGLHMEESIAKEISAYVKLVVFGNVQCYILAAIFVQ